MESRSFIWNRILFLSKRLKQSAFLRAKKLNALKIRL